ncbi:helix-turn-helix domain-containing protein [Flavobacteriaceae bacterium AU392]|nr:AraC family transcriptional regulator [Flavobacteriaceae bacterium]RKM84057.1 helix-turn-helix domain-containing protein [Flavobacteriaceae bacterium AU392]
MNSLFNFLNIIILLGTIQGVITSILLFRLRINKKANKLLGWVILLISLACFNTYLLETVTSTSSLLLILEAIIPLVVIMPIGPLIYFYVKTILNPEFKISEPNRKHFYSTLLDFIPNFAVILFILGGFLGLIKSQSNIALGNFIERYNLYVDIPRWLSLIIYLWLTFQFISSYKKDESNKDLIRWVKRFILGFSIFSVIWLLHLIPYLIPSLSNILLKFVSWYPIYIPLIVLVYWLGINGYIISFKTYKKTSKPQGFSNETVLNTITTLEDLMKKEHLYLNPLLKLSDVVKQTGIPQKTISAILNQYLNKSFNDYVNTYRIEEFKKQLLADNSENFTITGIAFECGFNSQATFQRVFKANTNQSPSQFRKTHLKA